MMKRFLGMSKMFASDKDDGGRMCDIISLLRFILEQNDADVKNEDDVFINK